MTATDMLARFWDAFETAYETDDWSPVAALYAPEATYRVFGLPETTTLIGGEAICAGFQRSVNGFDRKLTSRTHRIVATLPVFDDVVHYFTRVEYRADGLPPLDTITRSELIVRDGLIATNVNYWDRAFVETQAALAWLGEHGQALGLDPSYT